MSNTYDTDQAKAFEEFEKARQELHEHWHNVRVDAIEREEAEKAQSMLGNAKDTVKHAGSTMADIAGSACTGVTEAAPGFAEPEKDLSTPESIRNVGEAIGQ